MHGNIRPALAHRAVASVLGIGFLPMAPGTWSSLLAAGTWYLLQPSFESMLWLPWVLAALPVIAGLISVGAVRKSWGDDPSQVVIDEWAGTWIACLLLPNRPAAVIAALLLFRVFDIFKPLGIRRMERVHGAAGVMLDDILAGVYANLCVQLLLWLNFLK